VASLEVHQAWGMTTVGVAAAAAVAVIWALGASCAVRISHTTNENKTQQVTACASAGEQWINYNCQSAGK
jgi:uncharacterized protein with FMN-binding domain